MSGIVIDTLEGGLSRLSHVGAGNLDVQRVRSEIAVIENAAKNAGLGRANIALVKRKLKEIGAFGTPEKPTLKLQRTTDKKVYSFGDMLFGEETAAGVIIAPAPNLSFTREKKIVKTVIDGSDLEVVESFGAQSWEITFAGILVDMSDHRFPAAAVASLREIFETNAIFDVTESEELEARGIKSIYFERITKFNRLEDYPDTIEYGIIAHSIKPVEFFI